MAKVLLHDDPVTCCSTTTDAGPQVYLSDSAFCETPDTDPTTVLPTLEVRSRTFVEYDDDGNPTFDWATVVETYALTMEERTEIDDVAGLTRQVIDVTLYYDGDENVSESSTVLLGTDLFGVVKSGRQGSILSLTIARIDDNDAG